MILLHYYVMTLCIIVFITQVFFNKIDICFQWIVAIILEYSGFNVVVATVSQEKAITKKPPRSVVFFVAAEGTHLSDYF
jgi:hypothetical protein